MNASRPAAPTTVRDLLADAHARLRHARLAFGHGTTNAWDEAVYLVLHALGLPPDQLTPHLSRAVTAAEQQCALQLIGERIRRRVPAAYLTREAWLGDLRFYVDERVIVPRSYLAELLRARFAPWLAQPARIRHALDLCTGSGCLAVLLAKTFGTARVDAVDISRAALAVARRNISAYRLQRRVRVLHSDLFAAVRGTRYDLIIANPPYVSAATMRKLPPEYRCEPALALAGGTDGFDAVRAILAGAAQQLSTEGWLVVEIGHHRKRLEAAFPQLPFIWPQTSGGDDCVFMLGRRDLPGVARAAAAPRPASRAGAASRRRSTRSTGRA